MAGGLRDLSPYFVFLLLTATIGPLLFGYHLAELNAPSEVITCKKDSIRLGIATRLTTAFAEHFSTSAKPESSGALPQCIPMNPTQFGLVSSFFTLGGFLSALAAGPITARVGRMRTMLYASIFATLGPIFEALAPNVGTLTLGRFIAGLGAGAAMVVVPMYIFDIAPPENRGFFGAFTQVQVNVGILITQLLGYFLSRGQYWRVIVAVGGVLSLTQTVGILLGGQESPKYLAHNGKPTQAKRILRMIRGRHADIDAEVATWGESERDIDDEQVQLLANENAIDTDGAVERQMPSIVTPETNTASNGQTLGAFDVLRDPDTRRAVIAISVVMVSQQFTGINSIIMYVYR